MSSAGSPMRLLVRVGHQPHPINRRKYGNARFALYYANRRSFVYPGVILWTGKRHIRLLPLPWKRA